MSDSKELDPFKINLPKIDIPKLTPFNYNIPIIDKDEPYLASAYYERIAKYVIDFEKELEDTEEVGAKLVTFGQSIIIHIDNLGYWNPRLISFTGRDMDGQEVQLIQHVNQISVLLIKVKRTDSDRPRIGFKLSQELDKDDK
jgi:hypothetical protein